ncbi:MAG: pantoate--beta-alanine ligase [Candidatus Nanopelagicus sp.]
MIEIHKSAIDFARQKYDVLVPTMGALHAGHESLIKIGKSLGTKVLVSIFVNPLQFENKNDFANYPKSIEKDVVLAESAGADGVFIPNNEEIYPGKVSEVSAGALGEIYEGKSRPNHFNGVLTVVKRLFEITSPRLAVFGEKDFQQLFLIRKMVKELGLPIGISAAPTIRDEFGLALSSRNVFLDIDQRKSAHVIFRSLKKSSLDEMKQEIKNEPNFKLDYLEIIDEETFLKADKSTQYKRGIIAGWINEVRLIDNMRVSFTS